MMLRLRHKLIKLIAFNWSPLNNTAVIFPNCLQVYKKIFGKCLLFRCRKLACEILCTEHTWLSLN